MSLPHHRMEVRAPPHTPPLEDRLGNKPQTGVHPEPYYGLWCVARGPVAPAKKSCYDKVSWSPFWSEVPESAVSKEPTLSPVANKIAVVTSDYCYNTLSVVAIVSKVDTCPPAW